MKFASSGPTADTAGQVFRQNYDGRVGILGLDPDPLETSIYIL